MHPFADILIAIANEKPLEQALFGRWMPIKDRTALQGIVSGGITLRVKPDEEEPAKTEW